MEEKNHLKQDSGSKKDSEYFRLDRQIVRDFFLSIESGREERELTEQTGRNKDQEVKEDKS
jgi:hypothetical protein